MPVLIDSGPGLAMLKLRRGVRCGTRCLIWEGSVSVAMSRLEAWLFGQRMKLAEGTKVLNFTIRSA